MIYMMFECIPKNEMHKINHDSFFLWSPLFKVTKFSDFNMDIT